MSRTANDVISAITAPLRPLVQSQGKGSAQAQARNAFGKHVGTGTLEPPVVAMVRHWLNPTVIILTMLAAQLLHGLAFTTPYLGLMLATLLISKLLFAPIALDSMIAARRGSRLMALLRPLIEYGFIVGVLWVLAATLQVTDRFSQDFLITWLILAPLALCAANAFSPQLTRWLVHTGPMAPRHIIIGINDLGVELAKRMKASPHLGRFEGYFDHRSPDRLPDEGRKELVGHCKDVAEYVKRHSIDVVYIAIPLSATPRIEYLLKELRDTTASVYFVPNIFAFDLVHASYAAVNGMPVLSICETPLRGMSGIRKRLFDIALSVAALAILWPVLLAIAVAVRLTSRGPALFKQKRYGLNGEEISVYKFRSMTVCENGPVVRQATKDDRRITPLGAFLRKTSLDELPQIINVLEGKMSFVGPRPHAVAHNEMYRKLISGYMIRHKVRPGITGWAQVNGLRGETSTVEKMEQRVQFDLDYLRHWSLWLDVKIIAKTALQVLGDRNAY